MNVLDDVTAKLNAWQIANRGNQADRCLEAVRACLRQDRLYLPRSSTPGVQGDYQGDYAIQCGAYLAKHPVDLGKWNWALLAELPTDRPSLVIFKNCGKLSNGQFAGHIAIYKPSTNHIVSNETYTMDEWWKERIAYVFEPITA